MTYEMKSVLDTHKHQGEIKALLEDGWEPFAVDSGYVYFRRTERWAPFIPNAVERLAEPARG